MNADPRRPEKIQRFVPKVNNGSGQEDLTPDYMNILGQHQTTGNMNEMPEKHGEPILEPNLQVSAALEVQPVAGEVAPTNNTTNVIPTSPQYGVAIIPNAVTMNDLATETVTPPTETLTDSTAKPIDDKELHSTPSRNDRFKVVKIASLEPFKRGRWKCMDYVDEAPPVGATRVPQSSGSIQVSGGTFMQTQSLPQQQFQQMLLQSGFTNSTPFFANVPPQIMHQGQYYYPQVTNVQNQTMQQVPNSIPAQFIANQPYFPAGIVPNAQGFTMPQGYSNVQYVPANLIQNQGSAFVPTSQPVQLPPNFQQSQSYAGQPNVSQTNVQPVMNGHTYTPQNEQVSGSLPTQTVKSVIMNSNNTQPVVSQTQVLQQNVQNIPVQSNQNILVAQVQQYQQQNAFQQNAANQQQSAASVVPVQVQPVTSTSQVAPVQSQTFEQNLPNNVYTNPQFAVSVSSLTVLDNSENQTELTETSSGGNVTVNENTDDPAKTNPVVNAIDNKIEQAMDLVKSHLMYTVREEVEVLKEKIAELMERIQQLETENNFLRSQIPKSQTIPPTPASNIQQSNIVINPNPNFPNPTAIPTSDTATVTNNSHNHLSNSQSQSVSTTETPNPQ
ncbi:TSC22 domain family protein 2 isoform X1 [Diorhabda carinulata]|uniref:TSC22 domain family protein 2 isoform X1 n=2 Tax=Diorhabda carinulata TaxID=1163345 RepID=UPI0025A263EB|nr:TSC22 domain family protein 2 isoform X1 [Diorhabda carinulata]